MAHFVNYTVKIDEPSILSKLLIFKATKHLTTNNRLKFKKSLFFYNVFKYIQSYMQSNSKTLNIFNLKFSIKHLVFQCKFEFQTITFNSVYMVFSHQKLVVLEIHHFPNITIVNNSNTVNFKYRKILYTIKPVFAALHKIFLSHRE